MYMLIRLLCSVSRAPCHSDASNSSTTAHADGKAGLLSEGDLERTDRADTDPLGDPRAFGATTPTR